MIRRNMQGKTNGRSLLMWTGAGHGQESIIGPAPAFRLVGPHMKSERDGRDVAIYHEGAWFCGSKNRSFSVMWAEHETMLRCEDPATGQTALFGPFDMIGLVDKTIYVNREHSRGLAYLDEATRKWVLLESGVSWPQLVLLPAPAPAFRLEHIWPTVDAEFNVHLRAGASHFAR